MHPSAFLGGRSLTLATTRQPTRVPPCRTSGFTSNSDALITSFASAASYSTTLDATAGWCSTNALVPIVMVWARIPPPHLLQGADARRVSIVASWAATLTGEDIAIVSVGTWRVLRCRFSTIWFSAIVPSARITDTHTQTVRVSSRLVSSVAYRALLA